MGAGYYVQYNAIVYLDPTQYETNYLYIIGDFWYLVNAMIYTTCSMRDAEWFWFMPCNGRLQDFVEMARLHYFSAEVVVSGLGVGISGRMNDDVGMQGPSLGKGGLKRAGMVDDAEVGGGGAQTAVATTTLREITT